MRGKKSCYGDSILDNMFNNNVLIVATGTTLMRIKYLIKHYGMRSYMPALVAAD